MTKLKGTILLGEGYNKTKAVFNGNIDTLEVKSISIKDSTARDILLGNGTTLPLFNGSNTINSQYLPSYVDDVIEAPSQNDFPVMGESGKIYLDLSTNSTYRWSGSTYVLITSGDMETTINDIVNQIQEVESNVTAILNILDSDKFKEYNTEYLTFTALEDSSVGFLFYEGSEFELLYSYDRVTWNIYEEEINLPKGNKLYLKADTTEIVEYIGQFYLNGKLDVSGNTMSIVYSDNFVDKVEFPHEGYTLGKLFYECEGLYSVHNLILPATELTNSCYASMFYGCTSLTTAPELPATTLTEDCYGWMFSGCTNLNYIKMLATDISASNCLGNWVNDVASTGTFIKHSNMTSLPTGTNGIPSGWTVEEYVSPEDQLKELLVSVDSNTEEIDILKNRIISTTYSELKDAVTNSTLTIGQYYRITDYVTTCNGTSAKVTDASTIDPANPVDGQSRSAGHLFDIIVRALSPNQLDENAVAVCNASETYYDSTFNGTVIKYSIENKYWSTEDGKGTIYYMKDHNDNECSYDFTNIEYYYAEATNWYLTFTIKVDSRVYLNSIINKLGILPFVILGIELQSNSYIHTTTINGNLNTIIFKGPAFSNNVILGDVTNLIVRLAVNNKLIHSNILIGKFHDVTLDASGDIICSNTFKGLFENVTILGQGIAYNEVVAQTKRLHIKCELYPVNYNKINGFITDVTMTALSSIHVNTFTALINVNITEYAIQNNTINYCENLTISCPQESMSESSYCINNHFNRVTDSTFTIISNNNGNIMRNVKNVNITAKALLHNNLDNINTLTMDYSSKNFEQNKFNRCEYITFTNCGCAYGTMLGFDKYLTFEGTSAGLPDYITIGKSVTYCTFTGMMQTLHVKDGSRYLHFSLANEGVPLNTYVYNVRGSSQTNYLEIPLYGDNNLKQIYKDASGRIFYTWEDNLVKKGYYINNNTDTEWKEIPTPEKSEVPTIPDAVTTALSVATLDLTTRTTIATIAVDETLAFTLVPAIQGEYRLVVVNSSETDITITMPTEENYQCLCGATLTIPAQTNIELIINVTDTLIYIRKG